MGNLDNSVRLVNQQRVLLFLLLNTGLVFRWGTELFKLLPNWEEIIDGEVDLLPLELSAEELAHLKHPNWKQVDKCLEWAQQKNHHLIVWTDERYYPQQLREIYRPPLLLFASGEIERLQANQIAMVGSRNPSWSGLKTATDFAKALSELGITITSGFALGIDTASHQGGLAGVGKTIAVLGSGLDRLYPAKNCSLAEDLLAKGGLLLSEFPLHQPAAAWHFPLRNRIISGLSLGILVIEATLRSGSLITARLAREQNRTVFAIPGSIYNERAQGPNWLIQEGAKLVSNVTDILEEFPVLTAQLATILPTPEATKNKLDSRQSKLLDCIDFDLTTLETISSKIGWSAAEIQGTLLELELKGKIMAELGCYVRIR